MSDFFHIQPHDSIEDLEFCYHPAKCAVYSRRLQIVILVRKGWTTSQIAEITTLTKGWILTICKRYNQGGKEALRDSREKNSGRLRLLSGEEMETIKKSFNNLPPSYLRTGLQRLITRYISEKYRQYSHLTILCVL